MYTHFFMQGINRSDKRLKAHIKAPYAEESGHTRL